MENKFGSSDDLSVERWQKVSLLVLDVDGVLTDGTIYVGADGWELKQFSVLDGLGLTCLRKLGIRLAVISGRLSPATLTRTSELGFDHVVQGRKDKGTALRELASQLDLQAEQICYVGDDLIDIPAIQFAGIGVSVSNGLLLG